MTVQEFDVVVVGSGAAGMVAALVAAHRGLSTVVVEKAPHYGGSTARSGGGVWIPNNEVLKRRGVRDTPEAARTYLHGIVGEIVEPERIDAYLDRGPEMLSFVLKHTPLKMCWVPGYSDYYPEAPGGRPGGRSIEPKPFNARKLGADMAGLEPAYGKVPLNVVVMQQDYVRLNQLKRHPRGVLRSMKVGARTMWAKATGKNLVGMGRALIGPLRIGLQRAGVPVELNTAFTDLFVENGVVSGVYVRDSHEAESAEPQLIRARRGVILACGGFEHNEQMRIKYQRAPITTEWTVGASANTGDGILAAEKLGAALDLMDDAWWGPTVPLVGKPWFALSERNSPGSIIVNMSGKRFMNESMPYVEACHHMYGGEHGQGPGPGENIPASSSRPIPLRSWPARPVYPRTNSLPPSSVSTHSPGPVSTRTTTAGKVPTIATTATRATSPIRTSARSATRPIMAPRWFRATWGPRAVSAPMSTDVLCGTTAASSTAFTLQAMSVPQ
ncbi:3-ketosteroid-delta-1-dehydrogenase [Mycobacterium tuberculosis]|nr:3-ketosteroid-delta-1-dehydrogenase [Mycobacterium tuberculosis]